MANLEPAVLVLADGTAFRGRSIGAHGTAVGEVVFNTAITGYQEILTDPSYCRQIVTLTYPHIGNTGVNDEDDESRRTYAEGLVIRDLPRLHSSWRAQTDLSSYLKQNNVVGIAEDARGRLGELVHRIHADGEVGREHDGNALRRFRNAAPVFGAKAGGADHHRFGVLEKRDGALGAREVEHHVRLGDCSCIRNDLHPAHALAGSGRVERAHDGNLRIGGCGFRDRAAHAPRCAGNGKLHVAVITAWRRRRLDRHRDA